MSHPKSTHGVHPPSVAARFWTKVRIKDREECWEWTASRKGGRMNYGQFIPTIGKKGPRVPRGAHRVAWELAHGAIPDGLLVCHRCDNPPCCNPWHLFLGSASDNMRDAYEKGRLKPPAGGFTGSGKFTPALKERALSMRDEGYTQTAIAAAVGVSQPTISIFFRSEASR